uniref:hypothetical protein n=1 Tax=Agathobacter sp. TaxID=2021311 RepID=UPI0040564E51
MANTNSDYEKLAKEIFGDRYMSPEDYEKLEERIAKGECIVLYDDSQTRPPFKEVSFEEGMQSFRRLREERKRMKHVK